MKNDKCGAFYTNEFLVFSPIFAAFCRIRFAAAKFTPTNLPLAAASGKCDLYNAKVKGLKMTKIRLRIDVYNLYRSHLPLAAASGKCVGVNFAAANLMRQNAAKISKNLRNSLV